MWFWPKRRPADTPEALSIRVQRLEEEFHAWEVRAMRLTREMSRALKSLAEVERREALKAPRSDDLEQLELEEPDLLERMAELARGRNGH